MVVLNYNKSKSGYDLLLFANSTLLECSNYLSNW